MNIVKLYIKDIIRFIKNYWEAGWLTSLFIVWLILFGLAMTSGCASVPEHVSEYNRQIDKENWELCKAIYERYGRPTYHTHSHSTPMTKRTEAAYIREDLIVNHCRSIIKPEYWGDHIEE